MILENETTLKWDFPLAQAVINKISPIAKRYGYFVCLYGSVLYKGYSGNDLDIQIMPFINKDSHEELAKALERELSAKQTQQPYWGLLGTYSIYLALPSGLLLDIVIRLNNNPTPRQCTTSNPTN